MSDRGSSQEQPSGLAPPPTFEVATRSTSRDSTGAHPNNDDAHSRPASIMVPSVQFDEQNLHATPSYQRKSNNASLPSSPAVGSTSLTGSTAIGPRTSLQHRREASANQSRNGMGSSQLAHNHSNQKLGSRTSAAGSSVNLASGSRNGTACRRSRANPAIVTVPVWARDEDPSPLNSPATSPQTHSISRSARDIESLTLPAADTRSEDRSERGHSSDRISGALENQEQSGITFDRAFSPEALEQAEAQSTSPDRWWTFTLPQKYRSRLHEHHLRMSFHHERLRSETLEKGSPNPRKNDNNQNRRASQSNKKKKQQPSSSDSSHSDASSSGHNSDFEMQERASGDRLEPHHGYGFGAGAWNGMAAGLGASGLLNNKQRGTPTPQSTRLVSPAAQGNGNHPAFLTDQQRQVSPSPDGTSTTRADDRDIEKQHKPDEPEYPTMSFKARMEHPEVFTVHQPATPGWASPWKPEERGHGGLNAAGYFPRTDSGRTIGSRDGRRGAWLDTWKNFLIHNPFVPLLFRLINIAFTSATLAVAIKLLIILRSEEANDAVGASPLVAIIFAPLSLVHVGFQIWLEYFGRPIGLWTVQSKLSYTVVELVFICLWSSELSLTFDNYFTSTLICVNYGSPYVGPREPPADRPSPLLHPGRKPYICRLQGSLIGLVFVSLLAYLIVLTVSLFRIFVRVTGGSRR
ncbi:uncharacterized protein MEPE_02876 [Melanopsichium pennsylvanicum]|uniref:Uncharacterized protein n=2 Tax=Melanopsichium pennsylvanicum TaxID=63383 RepID=A0AAJ4XL73_9BASI|nr:conserved hypothetical protein [Melanopsichium pennsylvanicum 4]SNX84168.1 uncharacterized protein MEPE_02876 [Melanopsichium pennsylvanicum]